MTYTWKEAQAIVDRELNVQHRLVQAGGAMNQVLNVPCLLGPVGSGKSTIGYTVAFNRSMELALINCGEMADPADFGVPTLDFGPLIEALHNLMVASEDTSRTPHERQEAKDQVTMWSLNRQVIQATKEPVLLFFDDLDKAPPNIQGVLLNIMGNRMFRDKDLHRGTLIMGAGNRLGDDEYAHNISESLRTRMTIIEMMSDLASFAEYATATGQIHPVILGYLTFRPQHLHQHKPDVTRFPTPRGWWEASRHFEIYPDAFEDALGNRKKNNWHNIVNLKCGAHIGSDFWAWYVIISKVDVKEILRTGNLPAALSTNGDVADRRMAQYAAIFAISQHLAKGVEKSYVGLPMFIQNLDPEMCVALCVQLSPQAKSRISSLFPAAGEALMKHIVRPAIDPNAITTAPTP